jgi:protein O-GlcNAc transferase
MAMTTAEMFAVAANHHRAGQLAQAEQIYRGILAREPKNADALHLLGILANQIGRHQEAFDLISQAIAIKPNAKFYFNLSYTLLPLNDTERAMAALRKAVALEPNWAGAHGNLGTVLQISGKLDEAITRFEKSISLEPKEFHWRYSLGRAYLDAERFQEAGDALAQSVQLNPNNADAWNDLSRSLYVLGRFDPAADAARRALTIKPDFAPALNNLGNILIGQKRCEEAIPIFRQALAIDERVPSVYNNLGNALADLGRYAEAIAVYAQGIAFDAHWPEIQKNISVAIASVADLPATIAAAEQLLRQRPDLPLAHEKLANALQASGEMDLAMQVLEHLVTQRPHDRPWNTLGSILWKVGRTTDSLACFKCAADYAPNLYFPASNYLFVMQFASEDPAEILAAHLQWDDRFAAPFKKDFRPFTNERNPDRSLRIGYVSPDFRNHCQSLFTTALFPHHNREQFEIFCYSEVIDPDVTTERIKSYADVWRPVSKLSDNAIAEQIRADKIDVLVDLTMHMSNCRPMVFAQKPAPVQVCWLAYPGTSGLSAMDYRLTDPHLDPQGFDSRYMERSVRLPDTFWCYDANEDIEVTGALRVGELPALKNGFITFGCLNDFGKTNAATFQRWGRLMQIVPRSRLHLLAPRGQCRQGVLETLATVGINADRIEFIDRQRRSTYLAEYHRIDLCLDTFPYNGHTTSLDSFWMGVPVLTRIGPTVVGRAGLSQLTNLQLFGFAAETDEEFFRLGQRWAGELDGLSQIRASLRERMKASPLMNGQRFARHMEDAFRYMWKQTVQ